MKQFRGASAHRTRDVAEMIRDQDPDVFAIIEFRAKAVDPEGSATPQMSPVCDARCPAIRVMVGAQEQPNSSRSGWLVGMTISIPAARREPATGNLGPERRTYTRSCRFVACHVIVTN